MLHTCFDKLNAIAELNSASHFIASDSDQFEVFAVSTILMLWANGSLLALVPKYVFVFELDYI